MRGSEGQSDWGGSGREIAPVIDDRQTGETILDEALRMMKAQQGGLSSGQHSQQAPDATGAAEKLSVNSWIDLMSGETWNVLKIGFQLKQVRERLAKGLVDKGVLRTEKRNFLLFDMATHPVADVRAKEGLITRITSLLTATTTAVPPAAVNIPAADGRGGARDRDASGRGEVQCRVIRAVCLVCAAYTASVLDNAFGRLGYEEREAAFGRADEILSEFVGWPWGGAAGISASGSGSVTAQGRRRQATRMASGGIGGGGGGNEGRESVLGLVAEARKEAQAWGGDEDVGMELVAGVLDVLSKLDSLLCFRKFSPPQTSTTCGLLAWWANRGPLWTLDSTFLSDLVDPAANANLTQNSIPMPVHRVRRSHRALGVIELYVEV
ncbi:hypothetical protein D9619_011070 [Psilocybe cf. subviscida]|uniref:Uncharacterized protein n=1 Tax=Psilocybe cf. subviscida TaxID=2480587 RepID=A0A8H5F096_9AGAR|nr:hypothetical protein D9619_011070 [Psilocybe cf. subviscida]